MLGLFEKKFATLSMLQAKKQLEDNWDIKVIDVRSKEEYLGGHLPNSISIPLNEAQKIEAVVPNKEEQIFVYCLSGGRSSSACRIFANLGYHNITNIGGINAWTGDVVKGM